MCFKKSRGEGEEDKVILRKGCRSGVEHLPSNCGAQGPTLKTVTYKALALLKFIIY